MLPSDNSDFAHSTLRSRRSRKIPKSLLMAITPRSSHVRATSGMAPASDIPSKNVRFTPETPRNICEGYRGTIGRVGMWRGGDRIGLSVSASLVWRCLNSRAITPFPHPAHRTGRADFPHPALGQDFTPSPTARHAQAGSGVRVQSARKGARVDMSRPCVA